MTDKSIPWTEGFSLGAGGPTTPAEEAFLRDAERIAEEVAGMSDADVADYLVEHNLQDLLAPERVDALLASALEGVRERRREPALDDEDDTPPFAVRRKDREGGDTQARETAAAGGNVVRPAFGPRRDPTR